MSRKEEIVAELRRIFDAIDKGSVLSHDLRASVHDPTPLVQMATGSGTPPSLLEAMKAMGLPPAMADQMSMGMMSMIDKNEVRMPIVLSSIAPTASAAASLLVLLSHATD